MKRWHKAAIACACVAAAAVAATTVRHNQSSTPTPIHLPIASDGILPDPSLTPGALNPDITQANINQTICAHGVWSTKSIRPPASYTTNLKIQQLANGYALNGDTNTKDYELDHEISLELGGAPSDPANLWPQAYCTNGGPCTANDPRAGVDPFGAKAKDKVENQLHKDVCAGTITLLYAQQCISTDWTKCYSQPAQNFGGISQTDE